MKLKNIKYFFTNKIKTIIQKHTLISVILIILLSLLSMIISDKLLNILKISTNNPVKYLLPISLVILISYISGYKNIFSLKSRNFIMLFTQGWYIFIVAIINVTLTLLSLDENLIIMPSKTIVSYFIITNISIGFFEEIIFRGLTLNLLINSNKNYSIKKAIFISSLLFGLIHFINLFSSPYLILGTLSQVIYTFCLGILLSSIYIKSRNIFIPIFLHAFFNITGSFSEILLAPNISNKDINIISMLIPIIIMLPCIFIGKNLINNKSYINKKIY
ncbi:CPBP family intramembrane glutamic endopeptidase [Clostridioides difficile]